MKAAIFLLDVAEGLQVETQALLFELSYPVSMPVAAKQDH